MPKARVPVMPVVSDLLHIDERLKDIDPNLRLMFNSVAYPAADLPGRFEVHDFHSMVHPNHRMVMRVQEPNGDFRIPDSRLLKDLLEVMFLSRHNGVLSKLDGIAEARERKWESNTDSLAHGMADDLKWAGRDVTPSTAWAARRAK